MGVVPEKIWPSRYS
ncbi:helix-turn-helix domain-containing protein [Salmonella enterica subsp. enterica serovar Minnesota]|nr:helix-turn-helix domain-containing protein [Salmonella enterica]MCG3531735.1 helix-turn-helix domain-containing protein [Salmonella enterica subsp. enterica]MCG3535154.1 helix-turn-helix domain-containing protein [Salmonella enterica subsp. enterica]MCT6980627.1 helix-turn-helix domain-containing protein [Salmonella enterica subsp. enterica serovar Oranienburg]MCT7024331.1 helix-turn-helix domain-containing protein [Salmonella enterica subsp. enterica serovar Minnesota]MCT7059079.1 helix-tu